MGNHDESIVESLDAVIALLGEMADNTPRLSYTAAQAVARTGASLSRIYEMVTAGELDKVPGMGTSVLIPHDSLVRRFRTKTFSELYGGQS